MPKLTYRNDSPHFRILRPSRIRGNMCLVAKINLEASNMAMKVSGKVCMLDLYNINMKIKLLNQIHNSIRIIRTHEQNEHKIERCYGLLNKNVSKYFKLFWGVVYFKLKCLWCLKSYRKAIICILKLRTWGFQNTPNFYYSTNWYKSSSAGL